MVLNIIDYTHFEVRLSVWIPIGVRLERACMQKVADIFL